MAELKDDLLQLVSGDIAGLVAAEKGYGDSWKRRGGSGAFFVLARKWDRIENQVKQCGWDIFESVARFPGKEGVLDDIRDLRRYLLLVEREFLPTGTEQPSAGYCACFQMSKQDQECCPVHGIKAETGTEPLGKGYVDQD